jgi:hypothetical protein
MKFDLFVYLIILSILEIYLSLKTHTHTKTSTKTSTRTKTNSKSKTNMNSHFKAKFIENLLSQKTVEKMNLPNQITNWINFSPIQDNLVNLDLGPGPIYWNGWIKYFKTESNSNTGEKKPSSFFENHYFYKQIREHPELNTTLIQGNTFKYIKDKFSFYALLTKDFINILSSREKDYEKTVDVINLDNLELVKESNEYSGGIQDFGNYKEGYCLKLNLNLTLSKNSASNYVICTNTREEKIVLMQFLKKIKIKKQRAQGYIVTDNKINQETLLDYSKKSSVTKFDDLDKFTNKPESALDGYWIVIQPWTQCNLKCGGGNSTLQRICRPPLPGGKECIGPEILVRQCNLQPCPDVNRKNKLLRNSTLPPIIKTMPFLSRPQRNFICRIKESDMLYTKDLDEDKIRDRVQKIQLPVRVVMNNRTISIFGNEDYESVILSFDLQRTTFHKSPHESCFVLKDLEMKDKIAELCPFGADRDHQIFTQWENDFSTFKQKCYSPLPSGEILFKDLRKKYEEKVNDAKMEVALEREALLERKLKQKEETDLDSDMKKTNELAFNVIKKELTLEELIKREEEERERREQDDIKSEIECEEKKSKVLMQVIQEKEIEEQYNVQAQKKQKEIEGIKKELAKEVQSKRNQLKNYVMLMRRRAERNKMALRNRLVGVRMSLASKMKNAYKDGESGNCEKGMADDKLKNSYCVSNFSDDYTRLPECNGPDFCQVCCENEFGSAVLEKRQKCIDEVCSKIKEIKDASETTQNDEEAQTRSMYYLNVPNPPKI